MYVIPMVLTEEQAMSLSHKQLTAMADCSTDMVFEEVQKYLANQNANSKCRELISGIYSQRIAMEEFLSSADTADKVQLITGLDYGDINPMYVDYLRNCAIAIREILYGSYAVPYISPVSKSLYEVFIETLDGDNVKDFKKTVEKYKRLFKDSRYAAAKGTVVKRILRNRSKYEIMLRGIDFLTKKVDSGASPMSWRYL